MSCVRSFLFALLLAGSGLVQAATPVSFTIHGPSQVHELTSADYAAVIAWSDGTRSKAPAFWSSSDTSVASILFTGRLQTAPVASNTSLTISASYAGPGGPLSASKTVTVLDASSYPSLAKSLVHGWNLLGNSINSPLGVVQTFGDVVHPVAGITDAINSVWKWDSVNSRWAFFSPLMTPGQNAAYAAGKSYSVLHVVYPGEGFWVNAVKPVMLPPRSSGSISLGFSSVVSGWNLLATGQGVSPSAFNAALAMTPPSPGQVAQSFTSLWGWDASAGKWLFYAPSLEASGGLAAVKSHAEANGYLDFPTVGRTLGHGHGFWVNSTTDNTASNLAPLGQAKAMFTELRTTVRAYTNDLRDGFLDGQATRMRNDIQGKVSPALSRAIDYLDMLQQGMRLYEDIRDGVTTGYFVNPGSAAGTVRAVRQYYDDLPLITTCASNDYPSASGVTAAGLTEVSCSRSPSQFTFTGFTRTITEPKFTITAGASASEFNWTSVRVSEVQSFNFTFFSYATSSTTTLPGSYAGTMTRTYLTGTTHYSAFSVNGDFPPSRSGSERDAVNLSASRAVQDAPNLVYRYNLSGSITSKASGGAAMAALSLGSGTYFDRKEAPDGTPVPGGALMGVRFAGIAQTSGSRLTGTMLLSAYAADADGLEWLPTSLVFDGTVEDLSPSGAGVFVTGQFTMTLNNLASYHSNQLESSSNFLNFATAFVGTINSPDRPELRLTAGTTRTGMDTFSINTTYTYGAISVAGTGTLDQANPDNSTLTLTNQAGVTVVFQRHADAVVSKGGTTLGTIPYGSAMVYFSDGHFESL